MSCVLFYTIHPLVIDKWTYPFNTILYYQQSNPSFLIRDNSILSFSLSILSVLFHLKKKKSVGLDFDKCKRGQKGVALKYRKRWPAVINRSEAAK